MIAECNFFNKITIIIILNILYNNFETIMASMLKSREKTIKEI